MDFACPPCEEAMPLFCLYRYNIGAVRRGKSSLNKFKEYLYIYVM